MGVTEILLGIVGLSILVIVHESGHYLAARALGMRVLRYSIGFGPTLFKYQPKGSPTIFQVAAIPFLAYVQIAGMNPHEDVDPEDPEIYPNKSVFARIVTIAAGPVANYLAASLFVFTMYMTGTWVEKEPMSPMVVAGVQEGTPAAEAGIEPGDVIVEAHGQEIEDVAALIELTKDRAGEPTVYVVERNGERLPPMEITPKEQEGRGVIGVIAEMKRSFVQKPFVEAAEASVALPWIVTVRQLEGIAEMVKTRRTDNLGGPVKMTQMVGDAAESGLPEFFQMLTFLSVALGLFNLLPFPALDGGRLVFLSYEVVTRRRPNERFETMVHTVGILFLLAVLVLVTFRDILG